MIPRVRAAFLDEFSRARHSRVLEHVRGGAGRLPPYRVAESPVLIPGSLARHFLAASRELFEAFVRSPTLGDPAGFALYDQTRRETTRRPTCVCVDFAVVEGEGGEPSCELIECNGGQSLYGLTELLAEAYQRTYPSLAELTPYLGTGGKQGYHARLDRCMRGATSLDNVAQLDVRLREQANYADHGYLERVFGWPAVSLDELEISGASVDWVRGRQRRRIRRVLNRILLDDLRDDPGGYDKFRALNQLELEWINHPSWFYRISKAAMPGLEGPYFPECHWATPALFGALALDDYVLKPCFGFGGRGVVLHPEGRDVELLATRDDYILQRRVEFARCLPALHPELKVEVRLLFTWAEDDDWPVPVLALARLTRGEHMALRYNLADPWTGLSVCLFPEELGDTGDW